MIPSGTVTTRVPREESTKKLIKNIACENWREVSNAILKHKELAPEINIAIRKAVSKEFSDYLKCETMLLARVGGGVLRCMGCIGMCGPKGYGFSAVLVINRVSIFAL